MDKIGIIGAGNFGTAIAKILQNNGNEILFYVRTQRNLENSTTSFENFFNSCKIIFIIIPVENIINLLSQIKNFVKPHHCFIHCIKGLIVTEEKICKENIFTVSEFIKKNFYQNSVACFSGPNLANEIKNLQLTSSVIAGEKKIRDEIKSFMPNEKFFVYESEDIIGIELCGITKNIIALASGILNGLGEGDNAKSILMTLGLQEMMQITKIFTSINEETFYGVAGLGDLIATCSSKLSRNFTVGNRIANGEKLQNILDEGFIAEGVKTTFYLYKLVSQQNLKISILEAVYKILFENTDPKIIFKAIRK